MHFCGFLVCYISAHTDTQRESPAAEPPTPSFCPKSTNCISPPDCLTPHLQHRHAGAGVWHIPSLKQAGCPLPRKARSVQARPRARSGAHCRHSLPDSDNRALFVPLPGWNKNTHNLGDLVDGIGIRSRHEGACDLLQEEKNWGLESGEGRGATTLGTWRVRNERGHRLPHIPGGRVQLGTEVGCGFE